MWGEKSTCIFTLTIPLLSEWVNQVIMSKLPYVEDNYPIYPKDHLKLWIQCASRIILQIKINSSMHFVDECVTPHSLMLFSNRNKLNDAHWKSLKSSFQYQIHFFSSSHNLFEFNSRPSKSLINIVILSSKSGHMIPSSLLQKISQHTFISYLL